MRGELFAALGGHARGSDRERRSDTRYGSPGREGGARTLSRVGFLGSGLAAAAGALGGYAARAGAAGPVQAWGLDPDRGGTPGACGCSACASCRAHAAHKLFASAAAADAGRAHPYCKCLVVPLARLDENVYTSLFVNGGGRHSVDRRHQWVQAVFSHAPAARLSSFAPPVEASVRVPPAVRAALGRVRVRRTSDGRVLYADVAGDQLVSVSLAINSRGPTIARKVVAGVTGPRRLKLVIPQGAEAGPARLRVRFRNDAGTVKIVMRGIRIPHP